MATTKLSDEEIKKQNEDFLKSFKKEPETAKKTKSEAQASIPAEEGKYTHICVSCTAKNRAEWKSFFSKHDINLSSGIGIAISYLISQAEQGEITLSKFGITNIRK